MKRFAIVALMMLESTIAATAQPNDLQKRLAKCAAIKGDLERLECYDNIAKDFGLVSTTQTETIKGAGKWVVSTDTNPIDDTKTVFLGLPADEGKSRMGEEVTLVIRCKSGKINLFINWYEYLGSEAVVISRVGSKKAERDEWSLSTDHTSTFYPDNPVSFIKKLLAADRFVAQITPYNESPVTAVFDVKGLAEAIKPLVEVCPF